MIRLTVLYPNTEGAWFNMDYYLQKHVPLVKERIASFGPVRVDVEEGMTGAAPDTPSPFCLIFSMTFKSLEDLQTVMTMYGEELVADIVNFTNIQVIMQISRVIEPVTGR
jgi:uncharacterized protein (TIGR02118 family)